MGAGSYLGAGYAQKNIGAAVFGLMSTVEKTDQYGNPTGKLGYREGTLVGGYARAFGPFALAELSSSTRRRPMPTGASAPPVT
jgi:hypothetical protein